jgi:hydrogenase maturation protease
VPAALVVGLGHPDRGDDAVGPLVAARLRDEASGVLEVRTSLDPLRLPDLWAGRGLVVVVDAAAGAGPAGTVRVHDASSAPLPVLPASPGSTHGLSLPDVVELSRRTGRLPPRLLVVSVAGSSFVLGEPPSPAVAAAVPAAAAAVLEVVSGG